MTAALSRTSVPGPRVRAVQERRRSGAAGIHTTGTRRQRDRKASRQAAIRDSVRGG